MTHLNFKFQSSSPTMDLNASYSIVGVVGSGNLEVLVEKAAESGFVQYEVTTNVSGYDHIWQAVLNDIADEYKAGGLKISINDGGAVPAVVNLRVRQALEEFMGVYK